MCKRNLTAFKTYDIRGKLGHDMDEDVAYRLGRSAVEQFRAVSVIIGWDARETSEALAGAVARGVTEGGADVWSIGLAGTEEMYCSTAIFGASVGIQVTASHNPIEYNGMKLVKSGACPLDPDTDFKCLKRCAQLAEWQPIERPGKVIDKSAEARSRYTEKVLNFVDIKKLRPLKILVNSGNGAAGPTFDAIADRLNESGAPLTFVRQHHFPDPTFPYGIPNPLLPENQPITAKAVRTAAADFGVAFDGDFDRCFFFDELGNFIPGEYLVGLLTEILLSREPGAVIVHDTRVIWNTQTAIRNGRGIAVCAKAGHAYIKAAMRKSDAIYGGEMSAHHYFRDFFYCDSGIIPWLLIAERLSVSGRNLSELVADRRSSFPSSGERNFTVQNADRAIARVIATFETGAKLDVNDGISLEFEAWRFNLRKSQTEPLVRLNVEARGGAVDLNAKVAEISRILIDG